MHLPTGEQFTLSLQTAAGEARAIITGVGAGLRLFGIGQIDVVEPFDQTLTPPMGAGAVLVPWPNRIRDGKWQHEGEQHQLAITEPIYNNATHGLLRYSPYTPTEQTPDSVTLAATIYPQPGYHYILHTSVQYRLVQDGLEVRHQFTNLGTRITPVAVGAHPYLRIGDVPTEQLALTLAAQTRFELDDRMNPVAELPVAGTEYDLRTATTLGDRFFDDGFGQGITNEQGEIAHRLQAPDGRALTLWGDENFKYVQVYTPAQFPRVQGPTRAIAIEPMTAPADAFNSGKGLRWLGPGEQWTARWGIRHHGF